MHDAIYSLFYLHLLWNVMAPTQGAARFKEMDRISAMVKQLEETEKLAAKMRMDMSNSTKWCLRAMQ